jgi:hypothetical protein
MTPDSIRILSLRTFKATVYCVIVGILMIIAIPNPGFPSANGPSVRIIGISGLALLGIGAIVNLVSLVSGAIAWMKGARRCPWIFLSALVFLVPAGIWIAARLNL